jgi:ribosomal protein S12 methylthiotransferase
MHYAYPTGCPLEIIDLMASEERICNYLDIPIQHINNRILKDMSRGHDRNKLENLLQAFRTKIPDVALRTTLLIGFPGETDAEFNELKQFVSDFRFDRLGIFPYSHEEGTPAHGRADDVPENVKQQRVDEIMAIQQQISLEMNREKIGKTFKVLIDRKDPDFYIGRTQYDSPEVDQEVLIPVGVDLSEGEFYKIKINAAEDFDLYGSME